VIGIFLGHHLGEVAFEIWKIPFALAMMVALDGRG
jgi:hypothetical protein